MGSVGNTSTSVEKWRSEQPRFQRQTAGGVYFWSSPNTIYGQDIDEKMYDKLSKKMKSAVVMLDNSKTMDGNHATIYYVDSSGVIQYFDEYGLGDFYYSVNHTTDVGNVSDWIYDGDYKEGKQLKRRR